MLEGLRIVAVIPARGGSKSIPLKNLAPLGGRPLLAWSVETARAVPEIDRILVSTDDARIGEAAAACGAEVRWRSAELAGDDALVMDAVRHLLRELHDEGEAADVVVLLEPTCPLRSAEDVRACLEKLHGEQLDAVATFKPAEVNPCRTWRIEAGVPSPFLEGVEPWLPRQRLPQAWQLNGAVYVFRTQTLPADGRAPLYGRCGAVTMPVERSVDIDGPIDLTIAEAILRVGR